MGSALDVDSPLNPISGLTPIKNANTNTHTHTQNPTNTFTYVVISLSGRKILTFCHMLLPGCFTLLLLLLLLYFYLRSCPDRPWDPPGLLSNLYEGLSPRIYITRRVKLPTRLRIVPSLRMNYANLLTFAFMACSVPALPLLYKLLFIPDS